MTQTPSSTGKPQSPKDPQREQRRKTFVAALILLVPFLGVMYLIFSGSHTEQRPGVDSYNMTVPEGRSPAIEATKQRALERVAAERSEQERSRLFDEGDLSLMGGPRMQTPPAEPAAIARSQQAHREAAQAVSSFYAAPARDPQVEELRRQVADLTERLESQPPAPDPMALAEKQYALAAKYLHGGSQEPAAAAAEVSPGIVAPVQSARRQVVSTLSRIEPDSLPAAPVGFSTPVGSMPEALRRGIRVCVDEDQVVRSGERIRLRLVEPVRVAGHTLRAGSILFGVSTIDAQRMKIHVSSIADGGEVFAVAMQAYDLDGGEGLYVPDSQERTAAKEAAAAVGSNFGSSISFTRSAGQQVAMDLARGAMTGGTQYLASKMRQVKVTVKAGYQIILLSKE